MVLMRSLSFLVVLAACSSNASSGSPSADAATTAPDAATTVPDGGTGLTCATTIAAYCNANACDQLLTAAEQDKALCPASLTMCGGYDVIVKGGLDTSTTYYYQAGQLVAIDHLLLPNHHTCAAGPATFQEPSCSPSGQTLPACQ
jgi:hypothetical protein